MMHQLTVFFCALSLPLQAQLTIPELLRSASRDPQVTIHQEQSRFLATQPYRLSPLQRLEFRTQNRELIRHQQEFGLRITPANPWEVRHNRNYFKTYHAAVDLQAELALKDALTKRYHAVIYAAYYAEVISLLSESSRLVTNQLAILERQSGSSFFDADDFVDLQLDLMERAVELEEAHIAGMEQQDKIRMLYQRPVSDSLSWGWNELAGVARLRAIFDSLSSVSVASVVLAYQKQRIELASTGYQLEKANINAGFLQTEFDNRRQEQGRTPFNISLGITIPVVNPNKGDLTKRHMDVIEATHELDEASIEEDVRLTSTLQKAERLFAHYAALESRLADYEKGSLSATLRAMEGGDPRIVLRFDDNLVKLKLVLAKIRRDVTLAYIEQLAIRDLLQRRPLVNFLSGSLDIIE